MGYSLNKPTKQTLKRKIEVCEFDTSTIRRLKKRGFETVFNLALYSPEELFGVSSLGTKTVSVVQSFLEKNKIGANVTIELNRFIKELEEKLIYYAPEVKNSTEFKKLWSYCFRLQQGSMGSVFDYNMLSLSKLGSLKTGMNYFAITSHFSRRKKELFSQGRRVKKVLTTTQRNKLISLVFANKGNLFAYYNKKASEFLL